MNLCSYNPKTRNGRCVMPVHHGFFVLFQFFEDFISTHAFGKQLFQNGFRFYLFRIFCSFGICLCLFYLSPTYRIPKQVKQICSYKWGVDFPKCPRCGSTMEREYQRFCDRCGQRLSWRDFDDAEVIYVGWDGPDPDNLP